MSKYMAELTYDEGIDVLANLRVIEATAGKYTEPRKVGPILLCLNNILEILKPQLKILQEKEGVDK